MTFDVNKYISTLENLVVKAEQTKDLASEELAEAFSDVCSVLKISKAESMVNEIQNPDKIVSSVVFYGSDAVDNKNAVSITRDVSNYTVACYVYPEANVEELSSEMKGRFTVLLEFMLGLIVRFREKEIYTRLTYFDRNIGTYNQEYFMKVLRKLFAREKITEYTACSFNLKGFSLINNQVGRDAGTEVMREYVQRLQKKLEKNGWVCRTSGDNFAGLFPHEYTDTVIEHLRGMEICAGSEKMRILVSAHAGFYKITSECKSPSDVMDKASAAMANARNVSKTPYVFYNEAIQQKIKEAKQIEHIFPQAVENEEFLVFYQPKTHLKNYRLCGAEALCRWNHEGEIIAPFEFIPTLEQSRDICRLDFYMLEHVCRDIRRWIDEGKSVVKVSVNFSRCHLGDMDFHENILQIINKYNVPHEYIEIELTETTTDVDFKELKRIVSELRKEGVSTSVDDFGVGYSSLNLIRDIPWGTLKIDKCFLPENTDSDEEKKKKKIMLKSVIDMSQALGLECITEGVETLEQITLLKKNNCFLAQGYYFDKPLPVDEFEKRLELCEEK